MPQSGYPPAPIEADTSLLDLIDSELNGYHRTGTTTFGAHRYAFRTTDPAEYRWASGAYADAGYGAAIGNRTATLATALLSIDDQPIDALFVGDPKVVSRLIGTGVDAKEAQRAAQRFKIAAWFDNPSKHPSFIEILFTYWLKDLDAPRRAALEKLDPLHVTGAGT